MNGQRILSAATAVSVGMLASSPANPYGPARTAVVWVLFVAAVVISATWVVRKAKARGKRLFVDQPNAVLKGLHPDTRIDHSQDAI